MKTLIILRHADALEKSPGGSDHERPLSKLGWEQAARQGRFLAASGVRVEHVLASSAKRAQETAVGLVRTAGAALVPETVAGFYNVPGERLLEQVQEVSDDISALLMVVHMPGVSQLLTLLTSEGYLSLICSPGTLAAVQFEGNSWRRLGQGTCQLALFMPPILPLS